MVIEFKNIFLVPDLKKFYGLSFFFIFLTFFFPKSISEFQKWTFINVQKRLLQNNVGISKNVEFYIINGQRGLKRSDLR